MNKIAILVAAGLAVMLVIGVTCFTKVRLNEIGIKVNQLKGGIAQEDFGPGYYFIIPGMHKMYRLDPTVQTFELGEKGDAPAVELRAEDQYRTKFDITVLYRIKQEHAHKIAAEVGLTRDKIRRFVRKQADRVLWDALGRLQTEDSYDVAKREAARLAAKNALEAELAPKHLQLVDLLIRAIEYDPSFEEKLKEKQLLDQSKALNVEKAKLEQELQKTQSIERTTEAQVKVIAEERIQEIENIVATTDAKVKEINANAEFDAQKLIAEAERHMRTKTSEGELAKTQAKAKGEKAINEAYLGLGGQAYITRQMIDSIEFGDIEINTNRVNPFDVNQFLRMLGLDPEQAPAPAPAK